MSMDNNIAQENESVRPVTQSILRSEKGQFSGYGSQKMREWAILSSATEKARINRPLMWLSGHW